MYNLDAYPFTVFQETDEFGESEYVVVFVDCKNIIGSGQTIEEAIEEAKGNLDAYLSFLEEEGSELPKPGSISWLDSYTGKITLRMPKALHRDLSDYAKSDGLSLNSVINDAIRFYLTQESLKSVEHVVCKSIDWQIKDSFAFTQEVKYKSNGTLFPTKNYSYLL